MYLEIHMITCDAPNCAQANSVTSGTNLISAYSGGDVKGLAVTSGWVLRGEKWSCPRCELVRMRNARLNLPEPGEDYGRRKQDQNKD